MKTAVIVLFAVFAMAAAQEKVKVVENADQGVVIANPDPFFYQPSNPSGYEQPSIGPAYVENQRPLGKQFADPRLRGGSAKSAPEK